MKEHPEYYKLIKEPIDMLTIENNIRTEKYSTEEELLSDFKVKLSIILCETIIVEKIY